MAAKPLLLVTGIQGGVGSAIKDLLGSSYRIVGLARHAEKEDHNIIVCDLTSPKDMEIAFAKVLSNFGQPDGLVNCAGIFKAKAWDQLSVEEFDETYAVNVRAPFLLSKLVAEEFKKVEKTGVIVNVASIAGQIGSGDPAYAATKAGLLLLTKSMAKALAPFGIRVCSVAPGPIDDTAMGDKIPEDRKKMYKDNIPMKRWAKTIEVAHAVRFLLSEDAAYITGATLNVDGGLV